MRNPRYNRSEFDAHAALMQAGMKRAVRKTSKPVPRYWGRYLSALFFVACGATVATAVASFINAAPATYELATYADGQRYVLDYNMTAEDCAYAQRNSVVRTACEVAK